MGDVFGKIRNAFVGTATPYYVTSGHFYLESNNIKNGQINRDSEIFINEYFYQKQKDKWLKSGDMVMVQSGHVGHTAIIPDELHNSIAHALIMFTDYLDKSVPYFFNFFFQTNKAKREIDKITTGNTVKHILASDMKDFPIFLPSYEEQTQIGNFFKQLDDTIALHQRELEKFKILKTSYLENIFLGKVLLFTAKNTITWEQRKLGDVVEIIGGGTPDTNNTAYWNGNIDWYSPTEIGNKPYVSGSLKKISVLGLQKSSAKILPANKTILFTSRAGIGDMAILTKQGTTNQGFQSFILKNDVDIYFLYSMGFKIKDFALKNASGSTFLEISKSQLSQMKLYLPSLKEQTQIGNFFKQLDDTIALHQKELAKYQQIKAACLEKMFVE